MQQSTMASAPLYSKEPMDIVPAHEVIHPVACDESPRPATSQPDTSSPKSKLLDDSHMDEEAVADSGPDSYTSNESDIDPSETESRMPPKRAAKRRALRKDRDEWKPKYYYGEGESKAANLSKTTRTRKTKGTRGVPVFEPTFEQFQDFYNYIHKIDRWGMRSGIVKIVPPKEWHDSLPNVGEESLREDGKGQMLKETKIKSPISQVVCGSRGLFKVMNVTKNKIYNPLQWYDLANSQGIAPPDFFAKTADDAGDTVEGDDGARSTRRTRHARVPYQQVKSIERRTPKGKMQPKAKASSESAKGSPGPEQSLHFNDADPPPSSPPTRSHEHQVDTPAHTSTLANAEMLEGEATLGQDSGSPLDATGTENTPTRPTKWQSRKAASAAKHAIDPATWKEFIKVYDSLPYGAKKEDYTWEACQEIEKAYWRTVANGREPMYGADSSGSLFDERTTVWNVANLDNLLNRLKLKQKIPGVNTPYLYFGAWRASFAWHVEDADLYSINYIHFGAPKQWFAIPQEQNERFERYMAAEFGSDAKECPQFLRHKSLLASSTALAGGGIHVNKVIHLPGEIMLTYPYGYHSGYNLGYNCAESVNFATEDWIKIGRSAKACRCIEDSVHINVDAWLAEHARADERKREREEDRGSRRADPNKRRRESASKIQADVPVTQKGTATSDTNVVAKIPSRKMAIAPPKVFPCALCPDMSQESLIRVSGATDKMVHKICCMFTPTTWIETLEDGQEVCSGFFQIERARWQLKCQLCSEKWGVKVQCVKGKCVRACHVTCGLRVDSGFILDARLGNEQHWQSLLNAGLTKGDESLIDPSGPVNIVVICRQHNEVWVKAEAARKIQAKSEKVLQLVPGTLIKVRTSSGVYEVELLQHLEGRRISVRFETGALDTLGHAKIVWDTAKVTVAVPREDPYEYGSIRPSNSRNRHAIGGETMVKQTQLNSPPGVQLPPISSLLSEISASMPPLAQVPILNQHVSQVNSYQRPTMGQNPYQPVTSLVFNESSLGQPENSVPHSMMMTHPS